MSGAGSYPSPYGVRYPVYAQQRGSAQQRDPHLLRALAIHQAMQGLLGGAAGVAQAGLDRDRWEEQSAREERRLDLMERGFAADQARFDREERLKALGGVSTGKMTAGEAAAVYGSQLGELAYPTVEQRPLGAEVGPDETQLIQTEPFGTQEPGLPGSGPRPAARARGPQVIGDSLLQQAQSRFKVDDAVEGHRSGMAALSKSMRMIDSSVSSFESFATELDGQRDRLSDAEYKRLFEAGMAARKAAQDREDQLLKDKFDREMKQIGARKHDPYRARAERREKLEAQMKRALDSYDPAKGPEDPDNKTAFESYLMAEAPLLAKGAPGTTFEGFARQAGLRIADRPGAITDRRLAAADNAGPGSAGGARYQKMALDLADKGQTAQLARLIVDQEKVPEAVARQRAQEMVRVSDERKKEGEDGRLTRQMIRQNEAAIAKLASKRKTPRRDQQIASLRKRQAELYADLDGVREEAGLPPAQRRPASKAGSSPATASEKKPPAQKTFDPRTIKPGKLYESVKGKVPDSFLRKMDLLGELLGRRADRKAGRAPEEGDPWWTFPVSEMGGVIVDRLSSVYGADILDGAQDEDAFITRAIDDIFLDLQSEPPEVRERATYYLLKNPYAGRILTKADMRIIRQRYKEMVRRDKQIRRGLQGKR